MKKFKQTKIVFLLIITLSTLITQLIIGNSIVKAASPGCYAASSTGTATVIDFYNCPDDSYTQGVAQGKCYVFTVGSGGISGSGRETVCVGITVGSNSISSTGNAGDDGISRDELGSGDCETETNELTGQTEELNAENCGIIRLVIIAINLLSALAGMAIVFSLMFSGYQYMTARDNAGQVQKAKMRIVWTLVALALFIFMYAILNYLVPGGVI